MNKYHSITNILHAYNQPEISWLDDIAYLLHEKMYYYFGFDGQTYTLIMTSLQEVKEQK